MKILLLGDYSNYHSCLARALIKKGHNVTVASDGGGWMNTDRNISLNRPLPGKVGGAVLYASMLFDKRLKGFDIVSLINPSFVTLQPQRLRRIFDTIKKNNGKIFLAAVGTDKAFVDFLSAPDCPLRYSEYFSSPNVVYTPNTTEYLQACLWQKGALADLCEHVYNHVDGVTTALYEYHLAMSRVIAPDRLVYAGIPIDTSSVVPHIFDSKGMLNFFLGRHSHRMKIKGTDRIEKAVLRLVNEFPDKCRLTIVENIPYAEYIGKLSKADVVLDQLYSYTPATNALLAMTAGQIAVSGAEPEYYQFIGENNLRPIVNAIPDDELLYESLRNIVLSPEIINRASIEGPEFVRKHNDYLLVADRCLRFWTSKM